MKLLFIGGTGLISSACSELAITRGHELFLLNRSASAKHPVPDVAVLLQADVYADEAALAALLAGHRFDAVADFIAYTPEDIERDLRLFRGRTDQFLFISSASAYQKPVQNYLITEQTPLENPYWEYSQNKIACEARLMQACREEGFPVTIIRPSLTYGPTQIPFAVGSWSHPWTVIERMKRGKKVIVPGDGASLWVLTWNADFAKGLVGLLGNPKAIGEAFQITSDQVLGWEQIYLEAYRALGLAPNVIHIPSDLIAHYWPHARGSLIGDKSNSVVFDNSKIKRLVPDFTCEVDWANGLRRALAWFESHPEYQTIDHQLDETWDRIIAAYERAFQ
ncbi:MAG TPA: NAD-dependent epimerase/dehydratase family protein [Anaerolineales bacterium]|nr:NAD-dependent epimerase/dehydratase family protein [Anaerolineales bacterium]